MCWIPAIGDQMRRERYQVLSLGNDGNILVWELNSDGPQRHQGHLQLLKRMQLRAEGIPSLSSKHVPVIHLWVTGRIPLSDCILCWMWVHYKYLRQVYIAALFQLVGIGFFHQTQWCSYLSLWGMLSGTVLSGTMVTFEATGVCTFEPGTAGGHLLLYDLKVSWN